MDRHIWKYAGETFSVGESGEIERAVGRTIEGTLIWKPVLRFFDDADLKAVSVSLDACAQEIARLVVLNREPAK